MTRLRLALVALLAPCQCKVTYDTGAVFVWRNTDASRCRRWGHDNDHSVVGSTAT